VKKSVEICDHTRFLTHNQIAGEMSPWFCARGGESHVKKSVEICDHALELDNVVLGRTTGLMPGGALA